MSDPELSEDDKRKIMVYGFRAECQNWYHKGLKEGKQQTRTWTKRLIDRAYNAGWRAGAKWNGPQCNCKACTALAVEAPE